MSGHLHGEHIMQKATATYNAPKGDSKVAEMGGVTFFDGQEVELNSDDHGHLINKLPGNHHFDVELGEDVPDEKPKRGPGRPRKEDEAKSVLKDTGQGSQQQSAGNSMPTQTGQAASNLTT
jgi:hypothetical protein